MSRRYAYRAGIPSVRRAGGLPFRSLVAALGCAASCLVLAGCGLPGASARSVDEKTAGPAFERPALTVPAINADLVSEKQGVVIDTTSVSEGYVIASAHAEGRLRFLVSKGDRVQTYDLPGDGTTVVCSLTGGSGSYLFSVWQNTEADSYALIEKVEADVQLEDEFSPYLIPNAYCDYDEESACVAKANELAEGAQNEGEVLRRVYGWIAENIDYDAEEAERLAGATGYVPDPDDTLAEGDGVCFDYASLAAAMLRSQGIPCKIVTGDVYPDGIYHAWNLVCIDGSWKSVELDVDPNEWERIDLTFAASDDASIMKEDKEYVDRFVY